MSVAVENLIESYEGAHALIADALYRWLMTYEGISAKVSFNVPFFYRHAWLCYISKRKSGAVELAFVYGNEMNMDDFLESFGRKQVRALVYQRAEDIDEAVLHRVLEAAFYVDNRKYTLKQKRKNK